jgi:alpha-aminoadipic semialdehyde synthase
VKEVPFTTWNGYSLEGLPNRDSTKYTIPYQIPKCETLLRGTFRYAGYCEVLRDLQAVNLINEAPSPNLYDADNWLEFMALHLGLDKNSSVVKVMAKASELKNGLGKNVNTNKLAKLGVFTKTNKLENRNSPLDALAMLLNRFVKVQNYVKIIKILRF